ncbi:hypothetical protein [Flavobacterium sp. U410]
MKHIVALYGTSNVGKSMTIKLLYQKLIDNYEKDILLDSVKQMKSFDGDIRVVITINGKVIGIESQGDPNSRIFESLPFFVELKCDIIICATRTRGGTVKIVNQYKNEYNIHWEEQKVVKKDFEETNNQMAELLFGKVQQFINE